LHDPLPSLLPVSVLVAVNMNVQRCREIIATLGDFEMR
jgi:hypothetical protein